MSTEAQPSDLDDRASRDDGLTRVYGRYFRRQHLVVALAAYLVLALLGLYANWKLWSYFDLDYLRYAGIGDYLLAPVSFLKLLVDPSFVTVWVVVGIVLLLTAGGCGYAFTVVRDFMQHGSAGKPTVGNGENLPFTPEWADRSTFRSYLRGLAQRPLWAAPILAFAAILAIHVDTASEKRDLRSFAKQIQYTRAQDKEQRLRAPYSRYELVSVGLQGAAGHRPRLVRLRSTDSFVLYYDVLDDQPVVVAADQISSEVDDANLADAAPPEPAGGGLADPTRSGSIGMPERSSDRVAEDGLVARLASDGAPAVPVHPTLASEAARPTAATTSPSQIAPAAVASERGAPESSPNREVTLALDAAPGGGPASPAATLSIPQPKAQAQGIAPPREQPRAAPSGSATPSEGLNVIETNVRQSQGSLEGLKSYLQQMEGSFVEIRKFIKELDGSLKQIDQAYDQLADQRAAVGHLAYADCRELTAGGPIEFGGDDATLSLEAVGWLFQSRREITAQRSVERQQWLVIEGHADAAGQPAVEPPLAIRRANAVREFLQSELGVSPEVMQVVGKGASGPSTRRVSLYDCLERQQPASAPPAATAPAKLGLVQSAAAEEVGDGEPVQPAAWHPGASAGGRATTLADLDPQPDERGQLVTVPGDRLFDTGSSQIKVSAYDILGEIGTVLTREPERRALIIGHSDAIGDPEYNRVLSERRARAVRNFLVDNFTIRSDRFSVEGRGEAEPIATNDTQEGRLANRRVEVLFLN